MSEKSKARTLRRKNQQDKKKLNNCFLTEDQIREKDMKELFLNPQRKRLEHKPKQEIGGASPLSINMKDADKMIIIEKPISKDLPVDDFTQRMIDSQINSQKVNEIVRRRTILIKSMGFVEVKRKQEMGGAIPPTFKLAGV